MKQVRPGFRAQDTAESVPQRFNLSIDPVRFLSDPRTMNGFRSAVALALAVTCSSSVALADPQPNGSFTIGAAGVASQHQFWKDTAFHFGARSDILFGRSSVSSFGFGPYCEMLTHSFKEVQVGLGGTMLLPIIDGFPLVTSIGAYGRYTPTFGIEPGLATSLFWGIRSYNHHSVYNMAGGLLAQFRYGLGPSGETAIVVSAQVDMVALTLPFQFLYHAIRGGSPDTRPLR